MISFPSSRVQTPFLREDKTYIQVLLALGTSFLASSAAGIAADFPGHRILVTASSHVSFLTAWWRNNVILHHCILVLSLRWCMCQSLPARRCGCRDGARDIVLRMDVQVSGTGCLLSGVCAGAGEGRGAYWAYWVWCAMFLDFIWGKQNQKKI